MARFARSFSAPFRPCPVDEIDTAAVLGVLRPLWQTKPETASRLRGRIEAVLDAAKAQGYRSGENPAAWRGHLAHLLPKRGKLSRGHHAAMDYRRIPAFVAQLRECDAVAAMALEFCILTAARSGEVYGARWSEIDMAAKVWILPAVRMKAAREHRIPLSDRALAILQNLSVARTSDCVFPSPRGRKPLSHVAMAKVMRRLQIDGPTVHGFRSAFRDWCGEADSFSSRDRRGRARAPRWRPRRAGLPARRRTRKAPGNDGSMGAILWVDGNREHHSIWQIGWRGLTTNGPRAAHFRVRGMAFQPRRTTPPSQVLPAVAYGVTEENRVPHVSGLDRRYIAAAAWHT